MTSTTRVPVAFDPERKRLFVEGLILGLKPMEAARNAGFDAKLKPIADKLMEDEDVNAMLDEYKEELERRYDTSRSAVLRHLIDAMEIARTQGDPKAMVMALREISAVEGHNAPVRVDQKHVVEHHGNVRHRLRQISDAELAKLAGEEGLETVELLPVTIEGEVIER